MRRQFEECACLFARRAASASEGGKAYCEECRAGLDRLIEAERSATGEQVQPSGIEPREAANRWMRALMAEIFIL